MSINITSVKKKLVWHVDLNFPAFSKTTQSYYQLKLVHVIQKLMQHWSLLMEALQQSERRPGMWAVPIWPTIFLVMQKWLEFGTANLNLRCEDVLVFLSFVCLVRFKTCGWCTSWDSCTLPACVPHLRSSLVQTVQFTHKSTLKVQLHLAQSQWHPRDC